MASETGSRIVHFWDTLPLQLGHGLSKFSFMDVSHFALVLAGRPFFSRLGTRCVPLVLPLLCGGCAAGQSGNEGELPVAPCANDNTLFEARIISLKGGCVTAQVENVLNHGGGIVDGSGHLLLDDLRVGDSLTAKLGAIYAYTHSFSEGDAVVVLPGLWGDVLGFQLLPIVPEGIEIHWGPRLIHVSSDDLLAADCEERLQEMPDEGSSESGSSIAGPAEPAADTPIECSQPASP